MTFFSDSFYCTECKVCFWDHKVKHKKKKSMDNFFVCIVIVRGCIISFILYVVSNFICIFIY